MSSTMLSDCIEKEIEFRVNTEMINRKAEIGQHLLDREKHLLTLQQNISIDEKKIEVQLELLRVERLRLNEKTEEQEKHYKHFTDILNKRQGSINAAVRDSGEDRFVSINVGGKVFHTIQRTLSNISPFFAQLFSDKWRDDGRKTMRDCNGYIFIDRSPMFFDNILNWSRNGGDPYELRDFIKKQTICTFELKTFMKTLDYFGIEYANNNQAPELKVGDHIQIYWRGDKKTYNCCVIKIVVDAVLGENQVVVRYEDGDVWAYRLSYLFKMTGPHNIYAVNLMKNEVVFVKNNEYGKIKKGNGTQWWHYGIEHGSTKVHQTNNNLKTSNY